MSDQRFRVRWVSRLRQRRRCPDRSGKRAIGASNVAGRYVVSLLALLLAAALPAAPAFAHGGEANQSASELVLEAIAILEVHPAPSAAVDDKIHDALDANDQRGTDRNRVRSAKAALTRGDISATERLLEQAVRECPDADILYVADQRAHPPCIAPAHALTIPRRAVGGTSEVLIIVTAGFLALAGVAIIRHPRIRTPVPRGAP